MSDLRSWIWASLVAITFVTSGPAAFAESVTLAWDANTESDLSGYRLYVRTASGTYGAGADVGNVTQTTVNNLSAGATYFAVVTAYNAAALESAPSNEVTFTTAAPNQAPTVALTSPANGATYTAPATVAMAASASDGDGTIARVEFYNGATKLGEKTTSPYTFAWSDVSAGSYQLSAKAFDNAGASTVSAIVNVSVIPPNQPPIASITSPTQNAVFNAPATIAITTSVTDSDGTIARVEFFANGTKLGERTTSPFDFNWSNVTAGSYTLTAVATDDDGSTTTSAPVAVAVNSSPAISVTTSGSPYTAPATIGITANASDSDGTIAKVEFYGNNVKLGEKTSTPYTWSWSSVPSGSHTVHAVATDNRGAATTSASVAVAVSSEPLPGISVTLAWDANTEPDLAGYRLHLGTSSGTYTRVIDAGNATQLTVGDLLPDTTYFAAVTAYNTEGLESGFSNEITFTTGSGNLSPSVAIVSPSNGSTLGAPASITVTASADDPDGSITRVEFRNGSTKLGEVTTAPYSFNWSNVPAGTYSFSAVAHDNDGNSTTSAAVSVQVNNTAQLSVVLAANPTNLAVGGNVTLSATVTGPAAPQVRRVEFHFGNVYLGRDQSSPYSLTWRNVPAGSHMVTAVAFTKSGESARSAPISVQASESDSQFAAVASSTSAMLPTVTPLGKDTDGAFEIDINGEAARVFHVWGSEDLRKWRLVSSVYSGNGNIVACDEYAPPTGGRFYRVSVE